MNTASGCIHQRSVLAVGKSPLSPGIVQARSLVASASTGGIA